MPIVAVDIPTDDTFPSDHSLQVAAPAFVATNLDPVRVIYIGGQANFNDTVGFPVRPGETVSIPVVATQFVYFFAAGATLSTPAHLRVLYHSEA